MKPIISVEGLGKSYTIRHEGQTHYKSLREEIFKLPSRLLQRGGQSREEFWALKDVSFDIMPGDRVGIIGRNGAGKSTLLKLLSRITEPTTGRITLRGRVASLLEVGTGFHPELTGRENIYLNGAILGMTRSEVRRKFDEIVDFAGVEKFLDTPVKRYSSGMYVRLAFAVAAHLEPEILIVDEVLAVGDAEFQKKCLGKMEAIGKNGRTILFVSHNIVAIEHLCTKGVFIQNGEVKHNGTVQKITELYLSQLKNKSAPQISQCNSKFIKKIWIEANNKKETTSLHLGSSFYICVEISGEISNFVLGFYIKNSSSIRVASFSTLYQEKYRVLSTKESKTFIFKISDSNLLPDDYYISLFLANEQEISFDKALDAAYFTIEPKDIFGTGRIYEKNHGICYLNTSLIQKK